MNRSWTSTPSALTRLARARLGLGLRAGMLSALLNLGLLAGTASGQLLPPNPQQDWIELGTEHFRIHYVPGSDSLALRLSRIAEETHRDFAEKLKLEPRGRVEVWLQEKYDLVNSASAAQLHRSIYIFPNPPYSLHHGIIGHYDDWLRLAFVHEYAHTVDMERTEGLWELVRAVTGFGWPNGLRPLWTLEGFAVWCESTLGRGGRIGSPTTEMVIRADVLAGRFREPEQWSGAYQPWPAGTLAYLYGGAFMDFLARHYGGRVPTLYRGETAGSLPWRYASCIQLLTRGRDFPWVLAEFFQETKARCDSTAVWIQANGALREGELVARPGTTVYDLLPATDGAGLYVARESDKDVQEVLRLDLASGGSRHLQTILSDDPRLAQSADGRTVIYTDSDVAGNSTLVSRLYQLDPGSGSKSRIDAGAGLHEPALAPDRGELLATRRERGRSRLVRLRDASIGEVATGLPAGADVFHPRWSPDGTRIVASVWEPPGRQHVWLIDPSGGVAECLTRGAGWDIHPAFTPDGRFVLFSSDRTGVWNLYAVELATREIHQVTNVLTGAFLPRTSSDGRWIYFSRYTSDGDEIRRLPYEPGEWIPLAGDSLATPPALPALPAHRRYLARFDSEGESKDAERTRPRTTPEPPARPHPEGFGSRLRFWKPILHIPFPMADEKGLGGGVLLAGSDPLGGNGYTALVGYGLESRRAIYNVGIGSFLHSRLLLSLAAEDQALPTDQDVYGSDTDKLWRRDRQETILLGVPWLETRRVLVLSAGLERRFTQAVAPLDYTSDDLPEPDFYTGRTTALLAGLSFDNAQTYPLAFSPVNGVRTYLAAWNRIRALDGERRGSGGAADLRGYLSLTPDFVAAARALGVRASRGDFEIGPGNLVAVSGSDEVIQAERAVLGAAEMRFRIAEIQRKAVWDWIFINRLHGAALFEHLSYRPEKDDDGGAGGWSRLSSVGARLSADLTTGFYALMSWDLIVAAPSRGDPKVTFGFSTAF